VSQRYLPSVLLLAAVWGASYLFIKVGVRDFQPPTLMAARLAIAFVPLFAFLVLTRGGARRVARELAGVWREGLVLGLMNAAVPFTLVAWGEKHVDSGVAGVAQASVPVFTALLALRYQPSERATGGRMVGIALGLVGVGVLTGIDPGNGWWAVAGTLAVVLAQLALFHILCLHGAAKLSLVTYLIPPFAVFYGATILGEPLRWSALGGLALILLGVALGSGVVGTRRRAELRTAS
jgi:drug/metabolite transporter (DMT)-like permease